MGLRRKSHWQSLLLLCLVPYLRAKLEATLARQQDEEDFSIRLAQTRSQRLYRAAVAAYPYVSSAWQVWVFCQQLLFVFGVARTHNPLLWLARVRLARLTAQDIRDMELRSSKTGNMAAGRYVSVQTLNVGLWLVVAPLYMNGEFYYPDFSLTGSTSLPSNQILLLNCIFIRIRIFPHTRGAIWSILMRVSQFLRYQPKRCLPSLQYKTPKIISERLLNTKAHC